MEINDFSNAISGTQIGGAYHIYIYKVYFSLFFRPMQGNIPTKYGMKNGTNVSPF